jgi:hypothetical protein
VFVGDEDGEDDCPVEPLVALSPPTNFFISANDGCCFFGIIIFDRTFENTDDAIDDAVEEAVDVVDDDNDDINGDGGGGGKSFELLLFDDNSLSIYSESAFSSEALLSFIFSVISSTSTIEFDPPAHAAKNDIVASVLLSSANICICSCPTDIASYDVWIRHKIS